jgi:hypothetical protein
MGSPSLKMGAFCRKFAEDLSKDCFVPRTVCPRDVSLQNFWDEKSRMFRSWTVHQGTLSTIPIKTINSDQNKVIKNRFTVVKIFFSVFINFKLINKLLFSEVKYKFIWSGPVISNISVEVLLGKIYSIYSIQYIHNLESWFLL